MTLYELNKKGYATLIDMSAEDITEAIGTLIDNLNNREDKEEYSCFMLLCKEKNDYTVFRYNDESPTIINIVNLANEIFNILTLSRNAKIKGVEYNKDGTIDFWVKIDDEIYMYKLFDYDWGVIQL